MGLVCLLQLRANILEINLYLSVYVILMLKIQFTLLLLMLFAGSVFAGTIVKVGETVPVGGTTTHPEPKPAEVPAEPEEQEQPEESTTQGGLGLTTEDGKSTTLGSDTSLSEPATSDTTQKTAPPISKESTSPDSAPLCASAFVVLSGVVFAFVRRA